jgi:hypothetical protein
MIYEIQERIATRLMTRPDLAERVYIERARQLSESDLPCVDVRFTGADVDNGVLGQIGLTGHFEVKVRVLDAEPHAPAMKADLLGRIARGLLYTDANLSGLLPNPLCIDAIRAETNAEGELIVRSIVLELSACWIECPDVDFDALADLRTVHVDIDMASPRNDPPLPGCPDGQIDARETIHLPQ